MQLTGKIVLITGAQQEIGRATAIAFAAADVAVNWRDEGRRRTGRRRGERLRRRALTVRADVGRSFPFSTV